MVNIRAVDFVVIRRALNFVVNDRRGLTEIIFNVRIKYSGFMFGKN